MLFKKKPGFTLFELLLVIAVVSIIVMITLPLALRDFQGEKTKSVTVDISSNLYVVQQYANSRKNNKSYGVRLLPDRFVLFIGESFIGAESTEEIALPQGILIQNIQLEGSGTDLIFNSGSFKTGNYGTFEITNVFDTFLLTVNQEGLIYFEEIIS